MKGDVFMLENYKSLWYLRMMGGMYPGPMEYGDELVLSWIKPLEIKDILKASVDFHFTSIIEFVTEKFPEYEPDYIKKLIWYNRSGINKRLGRATCSHNSLINKNINQLIDINIWNKIKPVLNQYHNIYISLCSRNDLL
jgi:hypothetical protein